MTDRQTDPTRTAIVTGASKGIGAAIAQRLARDGIAVVVNYARGQAEAEAVVGAIEAEGGKAIAVQADIADPAGIATLFDAGEKALGGVDILVNNAGIMKLSPIAQTDDASFDTQIAVNLGGVFRACAKAQNGFATVAASSISPRASSASTSRVTASMPPPRGLSKR